MRMQLNQWFNLCGEIYNTEMNWSMLQWHGDRIWDLKRGIRWTSVFCHDGTNDARELDQWMESSFSEYLSGLSTHIPSLVHANSKLFLELASPKNGCKIFAIRALGVIGIPEEHKPTSVPIFRACLLRVSEFLINSITILASRNHPTYNVEAKDERWFGY